MVATIIEIDVPKQNIDAVRKRIELCVQQTGDDLIGYRAYGNGSMQLIVKLKHNDYIPKHQVVLGPALQAGAISSFTFTTCILVKLIFEDESRVRQLATFPFREREAWFPSITEPNEAYLCLMARELSREQSNWIVAASHVTQQEQGTAGVPSDRK